MKIKTKSDFINSYDIKRQVEICRLVREYKEQEEKRKKGVRITAEKFFSTKIFNRAFTPLPKNENDFIYIKI